jgi:hypothetical protein
MRQSLPSLASLIRKLPMRQSVGVPFSFNLLVINRRPLDPRNLMARRIDR